MKARVEARKRILRSHETIRSSVRPLCRAIALLLAAGTEPGVTYAAGLTNLAHAGGDSARSAALSGGAGGVANLGVGVAPTQALQASQPSIRNLATAAQGIARQIAAQQAATAAAAGTPSNVPNGLAAGGLEIAPGVSGDRSNPNLWINANPPTQTVDANGTVGVDVKQTAQNAVLTWKTMNVGTQTTLNFDQSGGTQSSGANNWNVLNRVVDPSGAPSQILGHMTAQGTVLVINRNGILFGPQSQVNVHSLLASSLDLLNKDDFGSTNPLTGKPTNSVPGNLVQSAAQIAGSNALFLDGGLAALEAGTSSTSGSNLGAPNEILGLGNNVLVSSASQFKAPGDITIAAGASINTAANASASNGGFVVIAAPNVTNAGSITVAPTGQVVLAAGIGVALFPNSTQPQVLFPELTGRIGIGTDDFTSTDITPAGTLINTGLIQAARGEINLLGSTVKQNGVVGVTTSVNTPGTVAISTVDENIANTPTGAVYAGEQQVVQGAGGANTVSANVTNRAGQLIFGPGSVTAILPDEDGETATSSPTQTTFSPGSMQINAGSVWFQSGSLIEAPGATVQVAALTPSSAGDKTPPGDTAVQGRIYVDDGATLDVSGLANVELAVSNILLAIPTITANELADSPLLRNSFLLGMRNVTVDSTLSGTNGDGLQWVGSPLLNLSGDVSLMPRTVDQLMINGGTIALSGNEVMTANGSQLNLNGGYIHYLGGMVDTTRLVDANGAVVPIGEASPYDTYVGVAGQFVENHARWGVKKTWLNPLMTAGVYEGDFIVGGKAGTLNVFASTAMVLDGDVSAQAFGGSKQVQGNGQPTGGTFDLGGSTFNGLSIEGMTQGPDTITSGAANTVILQDRAPQLRSLGAGFGATTPIDTAALSTLSMSDPNNVLANTVVPVHTLDNGGFANVKVTTDVRDTGGILVTEGTRLALQPGGSVTFASPGAPVTVLGSLVVPSGSISITTGGNRGASGGGVVVGPSALLSAAGQWVNNDAQAAPGTTPAGSQYINGGGITLSAAEASTNSGNDISGSINLQPGSVIDLSGGGEMLWGGQLLMQNGVPEGKGGSLSLITYRTNSTHPYGEQQGGVLPGTQPRAGQITMGGTIRSAGFSGGGTLTLQTTGFQIGGDVAQTPAGDLYLPAGFFSQQGFGSYALNAMYDVNVAPGASIALTQRNLLPGTALLQTPSGASIAPNGETTLGVLDAYHRQATNLTLTGGGFLGWVASDGTRPAYAGAGGGVTVGEGARIVGDAGASIGLGSPAQVTVLGSIIAPGGSITLSADSETGSFALPGQENNGDANFDTGFTSSSKSVWLGPKAVLDVSGVALSNPLASPVGIGSNTFVPNTGKVLPGGSVTISDDSGYIVAQAGSRIDVSGKSAVFDVGQSSGQFAPTAIWSNAGSITLGASSGLLFDGTLRAAAGAPQADGGTLYIVPEQVAVTGGTQPSPGAQALVFQQSGSTVPAGLTPGANITAALTRQTGSSPTAGVLTFSIDRLTDSGMSSLMVAPPGGGHAAGTAPVEFSGNVNLTLPGQVVFDTSQLVALDRADTVSIKAPYVALIGPSPAQSPDTFTPDEIVSGSTLAINASFMDLENQLQVDNFGQATFQSSGDIRLSSTNASLKGGNALAPGQLFSAGNMVFQAAHLYPSTGSTFILDARGPADAKGNLAPTTIAFLANGSSGTPLSAGGTLLVDATNIVQQGTVQAPSGSLILGVGDPTDAATKAQFNSLPLVATDNVSFGAGSVTSVSLGGATVPYGTTVDGVQWRFNPLPGNAAPDVTAAPAKYIGVNGGKIALNPGATIDLSGGGNLQAEEWVAGTGGTRDVLVQYDTSYANSPTGTAVPTNVGAANLYAILPGAQSAVAPYDPVFAQTIQPSGSTVATAVMGVGHAGLGDAVGESVYLSDVASLPAGYYTLLPAKYATLPGAYRISLSSTSGSTSGSGAVAAGKTQVLADGTIVAPGYIANSVTGSRSATPVLFDIQPGSVWQRYSQYTLSSAGTFFTSLAASAGNATPPLPSDGGQLVLAASRNLGLGASLKTAAADGGAPAGVDIASQAIQIVGSGQQAGEAALPGYLQISASQLDALDAGSLLIGGKRAATTGGPAITPIAGSVVVSNDAASPLTGPEVMLVSTNGIVVQGGSAIAAQGGYPAAKDLPITIVANPARGTSDGALLRVSDGQYVEVTRAGTVKGTGSLTVGAGASLSGGAALTLDSSGKLVVNPAASLSGNTIAAQGSAITFTDNTSASAAQLPGFVVGPALVAQFAKAQRAILRSTDAINFDGATNLTFGNTVELSAGVFDGNGGAATINAPYVTLENTLGAASPTATAGAGTLTVNATRVDFGNGNASVSGFGNAVVNATGGIVSEGGGKFDFGATPVTLNAPVFLADTGGNATVKTTGALQLHGAAGTALALSPLGGAMTFTAGSIDVNGAMLSAPAGNVSLEATSGDLTIHNGSTISAAGVGKQFFDVTEYAPGGAIKVTSDSGSVTLAADSTLDFSGASLGGAAGSLSIAAPTGVANLFGTLKGAAASGYAGGSFSLVNGGAVDLDSLARELASSGVNSQVIVEAGAGNLTLSAGNTLTGNLVSLTADGGSGKQVDTADGNVLMLGTIDASGAAGGTIRLYGKSSVDIEGTLSAIATTDGGKTLNPNQRGGTVSIGTSAVFDPSFVDPLSGTAYNSAYGYESISAATTNSLRATDGGKYLSTGAITIGRQADIDVRGGTAGGLSGGTVSLRAPLLSDGSVPILISSGAQIKGSRATSVQPYAVWSTDDRSTNPAQHFDGIVDPAGWYDSSGNLVAGAFKSEDGKTTITYTPANGSLPASLSNDPGASAGRVAADLASDLENDYFTPAAGSANANHQTFYGYVGGNSRNGAGTLMKFVENGLQSVANQFAGTTLDHFAVVPSIDLVNPDPHINDGNISVLTNWNLGAGTSQDNLAYRFNGQAPVITFRAENNVRVKASLTDGFFQIANPTASLQKITLQAPPPAQYRDVYREFYYNPYWPYHYQGFDVGPKYKSPKYGFWVTDKNAWGGFIAPFAAQRSLQSSGSDDIAQYYALYQEYFSYLAPGGDGFLVVVGDGQVHGWFNVPVVLGQPVFTQPVPNIKAESKSPGAWQAYFQSYELYLSALTAWSQANSNPTMNVAPLLPPPAVATNPIVPGTVVTVGAVPTDNSPSPVATASNPLPLQVSSLMAAGNSSTFNLVAGAKMSSADPFGVLARAKYADAASGSGEQGSVEVSGNFAYNDANNPNTTYANAETIVAPTTIRTGSGSIHIAAANNVWLYDPNETDLVKSAAPLLQSTVGAIYTAGVASTDVGATASITLGSQQSGTPDILVSPTVNPQGAGDIVMTAQNNVTGLENPIDGNGAVTGNKGGNLLQYWTPWLNAGTVADSAGKITRTSIDFGGFDQGVMSVGGNVSVAAGGNVTALSVSLPTSWYTPAPAAGSGTTVVGGGNLTVSAGADIQSGQYFVAQGSGTLKAGGSITTDGMNYTGTIVNNLSNPGSNPLASIGTVPVMLATIDGQFGLFAPRGVTIGRVFGPTYFQIGGQNTSASSLTAVATNGDVSLIGSLLPPFGLPSGLPGIGSLSTSMPASLDLLALSGGIAVQYGGALASSPFADLSLIASQSIFLSGDASLAMGSVAPSSINKTNPVRIYSLNGSIVNGMLETTGANAGLYDKLLGINVGKPAFVEAAQNIVNLVFDGQNLSQDDFTRIVAGLDIYDTPFAPNSTDISPHMILGGPGYFDIEAGRNIGPLTTPAQVFAANTRALTLNGIDAIGNASNPALPHESANVEVLFGIGPGMNDSGFIVSYIDPSSTPAGIPSVTPALVSFVEQYNAGHGYDTGLAADKHALETLTPAQAWQQFQALPAFVQRYFVQQTFFGVLTDVGKDYNDGSSPYHGQYARGYQAINTLFPASLGYTANALGGGVSGANQLVQTGNLDIRSTTIQTQQGGNVSILGPGGEALVGASSAPPEITSGNAVIVGPGQQGILTLEKGDIKIFTDQSLLLAQSRVFTEQGGNMTIWSSNGDIDAGKGATSSADIPPPRYVCDVNHFCTVDARGEVTGAGIATLQSIPGAPTGDVNLLAPRGTVDAGAAGIRVSGNLNVAALQVLNAANIQVQGKSTGVPVATAVDTGALSAASAATSAVTQVAQTLARNTAAPSGSRQWQVTVEVLGFGETGAN